MNKPLESISRDTAERVEPSLDSGSRAYRGYVLGALLIAYALNVIDRMLMAVLNEPIRQGLGLSDLQMGLLGGPAFAILYTVAGLPLGRLADQFDRRAIIASCLVIWSAMTVLSGLAGELHPLAHSAVFVLLLLPMAVYFLRKGIWVGFIMVAGAIIVSVGLYPVLAAYGLAAFALMLMSRIGVGIGEAGLAPAANSLIADYFPSERRATALSIFALGAPLGGVCAAVGGAMLAQYFGWRVAFFALGLPGIILGLLIFVTVREPPRSASEPIPTFAVVRRLFASPVFRHVVAGASVAAFIAYGTGQFTFAFFSRAHGLSPLQASLYFVIVGGVAAAIGTFSGGALSDRLGRRLRGARAIIPGVSLILTAPLYVLAYFAPSPELMLAAIIPGALLHYTYIGPTFAITQDLVEPRMRGTAIAVLAFVIALVGYGLGPPLIGLLSDVLAGQNFAQMSNLGFRETCSGAAETSRACSTAKAEGLRWAMIIGVLGYAWAGAHFLFAAKHMRRDVPRS